VYLARDSRLGREVALALVKTEGLDDAGRTRVAREAQAMGQLGDHPHVVTVHDIGEENGQIYIVCQLMQGGDLEELLGASENRRLPMKEALRVADEIAQALEHAHTRGVIHRDLKPGNVWLTREGRACLGDFGLAVSLDRTRVTQEGMMVGTVAYMAPEQALGQTPDTRSDLYALGATLYEMLTGRPPFAGDDAVAIISQHVNTPPVAVSWHNPEIPRALDHLIQQLLAKSPDERPASASDVRRALADVANASTVERSVEVQANPLDALAGGVFVGREKEVEQLRAGVDEALSGRGKALLLVGEPGIGKTRTSEELATYARLRGARVLWGRCYEGEGAPTYWPWIQLVRGYVQEKDAAALLEELGAGAGAIGDVVSEVRERIPGLQPAPPLDPEQARFRLFDSIVGFLRRVSKATPLMLVLDDLHWSDKPSLLLLQFLVRELPGTRILVLGSYRDVELGRKHPLAEALAELARMGVTERILLRGLEEPDVARFLELSTGRPPPAALASAVYRETEGNPFFVHEVVRLLATDGRLEQPEQAASWSLTIPQGIKEVVGRRLSSLSDDCNELLIVASVMGREFELPLLERAAEMDGDRVLDLVEEAIQARLVEELPEGRARYRFSHALVRETLYGELGTTRRVRLHRRIAEVFESHYAGRLEHHLSELSYHAVEGAHGGGDVQKAIDYASRAGQRASNLFAFEDAAPHYERALEALELLGTPDETRRCDLLIELGRAQVLAIDNDRAARSLREAVELARRLEDWRRMGRAAYYLAYAIGILGEPEPEAVAVLEEAREKLGDDECVERIAVLNALTLQFQLGPTNRRARELSDEALELARRVGDPEHLARAFLANLSSRLGFEDLDERESRAEEARLNAQKGGDPGAEILILAFLRVVALERGDRERFNQLYRETAALAERAQDANASHWYRVATATLAILDARWDDALRLAQEAFAFGQRVTPEISTQMLGAQMAAILRAKDQSEALISNLEASVQAHPQPAWLMALAAFYAELGPQDKAQALLDRFCANDLAEVPVDGNRPVGLGLLSHAAAVLRDRENAQTLYDAFAPHPRRVINIGATASIYNSTSFHLGRLAAVLGRLDEAVAHLEDALALITRFGAHFWIAETKVRFAEILAERSAEGDRERAVRLVNEALEAGRAHDTPYIVRHALALKLELQGVESGSVEGTIHTVHANVQQQRPDLTRHAAPDGTVTIMFSDMEGFTSMTERLGDLAAREVVRRHNAVVREQLAAHGGYEVELQGDGFLLAFGSARRALACARDIQRSFADHNESTEESIRVRIGLHTGEALRDADKFFGKTVIVAARIAAQARGGEIVVSSVLKALTESVGDVRFGASRQVDLKGISEAQQIYEVLWQ
jgi:class 3 adenylate cyclase